MFRSSILGMTCYAVSLVLFLFTGMSVWNAPVGANTAEPSARALVDAFEEELSKALKAQRAQLEAQYQPVNAQRSQLSHRYDVLRTIEVTSTSQGYWLVEPKLMIAVEKLGGGDLRIKYADRFEKIRIGQRKEFRVDDCLCFLVLMKSLKGHAVFQFSCEKRPIGRLASIQE